jgi:hypothetical protein
MPRMTEAIRQKVFERDNYTCRYCGSKSGPFHADHVYPWSKGGETSINNIVTACERCNVKKSSSVGIYPMPIGYFDKSKKAHRPETNIGLACLVVGLCAIAASILFQYTSNSLPFNPTLFAIYGMVVIFLGAFLIYKGRPQ